MTTLRPQPALPISRFRAMSGVVFDRALSHEEQIEIGQHDDGKQQNIAERRGLAGFKVLKGNAIDVNRDGFGRCARAALGDDPDDIE